MLDSQDVYVEDLPRDRVLQLRDQVVAAAGQQKRRQRQRRAAGGVAVACLAIASILAVQVSQPTSAFATWQAVPRTLSTTGEGRAAIDDCRTAVEASLQTSGRKVPELTGVLSEARGKTRAALLRGTSEIALCISAPNSFHTAWTPTDPVPELKSEPIRVVGNGGSLDGDDPRYVYGEVSPSVGAVGVELNDGTTVTASTTDGYFLAWWPKAAAPEQVTAFDGSGAVLTVVDLN